MVKLEEVVDEELNRPQLGPEDEEEWDTDDESDTSSIASSLAEESLYDRVVALQDIIPPRQRALLTNTYSTASDLVTQGLSFGGKALWVISTSTLLVMLPWAMAYGDEQMLQAEEEKLRQQQTASDILTPGSTGQGGRAGL